VIGWALADPQDVMQRVARVLRDLSIWRWWSRRRAGVDAVSHIEFVRLRGDQLLAVIASQSGRSRISSSHRLFSLASDLDRINNYLNGLVSGLTLDRCARAWYAKFRRNASARLAIRCWRRRSSWPWPRLPRLSRAATSSSMDSPISWRGG